jgi:hypothetical protein
LSVKIADRGLSYYPPESKMEVNMAKEKKLVEAITSMNEDFAQWYTDVVKKAELCDYTSVKGFMAIKPYGYAI